MKSTFAIILGLFFLAISTNAQAQLKGQIAGKIIDKSTGEELIGVSVGIEGTSSGSITDIEGKFQMALEPGSHTLQLSYIFYKTQKIQVDVRPGEVAFVNCALEPDNGQAIQEVVIVATVAKTSMTAQLIERRNSAQVSDGISADLIRKTPDRTTSDVLKRVTGTSIQEGKFAIIRGMNDRYNAGFLDGALLPSTESDRKAFAFDAVPANLIDNLTILKAGTPDLVGDFGGGVIRINTKSVPEKFIQSITIGGQSHSLTTFKDFTQFKRFSGEAFNIFGSQRELPAFAEGALTSSSTFPTKEDKANFAAISTSFNNDWSKTTASAMPNSRFAYSLGLPIKLSGLNKIGLIFAVNYSDTKKFSENQINTFDGSGQVSQFTDRSFSRNVNDGAIFNVNFVGAKTQVNFRNLLNVNSDNNSIFRTGIGNLNDALAVTNMANVVSTNRLFNSILSVKQVVGDNLFTVNASANLSDVRRRVPDYRIVNYTQSPDDEQPRLSLGDFFNSATGRFASDLNERLAGGTLDISKQLTGKHFKTDLKAGVFYQNRDRSFWGRSFVYGGNGGELTYDPAKDLGASNIGVGKLFLQEKTSNDIAYYDGKSNLSAVYGMVDQKFFEKLRAVYGVRYENIGIELDNNKVNTHIASIKEGVVLPSLNLSYSFTEKLNLRAAYFASVNRPEFRELAPFAFYVFDKNAEIKGNKDLKIARLNNYDLRLELFPQGNQLVSIGGFYKTIDNPVEFSIDITQPFTTFTYNNEKSASIYGLEFEVRKNFDFVGDRKIWQDLNIYSNLALIKSKLNFEAGSQATSGRPLQGQSPYVINAGLQYENAESGWFASAVVNRIGRRIAFVGVDAQFGDTRQDIYETPRTVLDLQIGKNIGRFNLKLTVGDILAQELFFYQDADHNGKYNPDEKVDRLLYKNLNGRTASLSVGYSF